jgi:uncharacterized protein YkwD
MQMPLNVTLLRVGFTLALAGLSQLKAAEPTAGEQYWLELLNRARSDPQGELTRLTNYSGPTTFGSPASNDSDIAASLAAFGTSAATLAAQWSSLQTAAPLAWNSGLGGTADTYSALMVAMDSDLHTLDGIAQSNLDQRLVGVSRYGANWLDLGENLYAGAASVFHGHAGFLLDWGDGNGPSQGGYGNGIQSPADHRANSFFNAFKEIGIGLLEASNSGNTTATGPVVVTQHFGNQVQGSVGNYWSDAILTGVVYNDALLADHFYTPGEGMAGQLINVYVNGALTPQFTSLSEAAGGFNIELVGLVAGDTVRVEAPDSGLSAQTFTLASSVLTYGVDQVTFIDNIRAGFELQPVPEPSSGLLLAGVALMLSARRSRVAR